MVTPKKKPKGRQLTKSEKIHNKQLSKERIKVENAIGAIKHYKRVSSVYEGSLDEFNAEFNIACGFANARLMFRNKTYDYWQSVLNDKRPKNP